MADWFPENSRDAVEDRLLALGSLLLEVSHVVRKSFVREDCVV